MTDYARGERLQELRAEKRMSREDVAHEIGVTTKTLYAWEKRDGAIKWDNTKRIAAFYGVEPKALVTREGSGQLAAQAELREQLDRMELALAEVQELLSRSAAPKARAEARERAIARLQRDAQSPQEAPSASHTREG